MQVYVFESHPIAIARLKIVVWSGKEGVMVALIGAGSLDVAWLLTLIADSFG